MPRTVVPQRDARILRNGDGGKGDGLPEALVKYVPAEVLAFYIPAVALLGSNRRGLLIAVLVVATAGTPLYLFSQKPKDPKEQPGRWFYVLAVVAFLGWAVGTSPTTAALVGFDATVASLTLLVVVFLVPVLDRLLNRSPA